MGRVVATPLCISAVFNTVTVAAAVLVPFPVLLSPLMVISPFSRLPLSVTVSPAVTAATVSPLVVITAVTPLLAIAGTRGPMTVPVVSDLRMPVAPTMPAAICPARSTEYTPTMSLPYSALR